MEREKSIEIENLQARWGQAGRVVAGFLGTWAGLPQISTGPEVWLLLLPSLHPKIRPLHQHGLRLFGFPR